MGVATILAIGRMDLAAADFEARSESPLQLKSALQMTALFQGALGVALGRMAAAMLTALLL